jgi:hypothetical protein
VREVAEAYNFKLVGTELVGGREAWVIDGEPRPGFVPHMKESKVSIQVPWAGLGRQKRSATIQDGSRGH